MKSAQVLLSAVLAGLAGVIGTVWVMQPSEAVAVSEPASVSSPAASSPTSTGQGDAVAALGAVSLRDQEVADWLAALSPQARSAIQRDRALFDDWARQRLAEKALIREARQQGWEKREEVTQAIGQARDQILLRSYLGAVSQVPEDFPDDATLRQLYDSRKQELAVPERYHLRQIFLAVDGTNADQVKARAGQLVKEARAKKGDFAELARRHSDDAASAARGGDIGVQSLAQLTPEARPVVMALKEGEVSAPFRTASGWHVLKLEKTEAARTATFDEVRDQLRATVREQRRRQNAEAYLNRLVGEASLSINGAAVTALLENQ